MPNPTPGTGNQSLAQFGPEPSFGAGGSPIYRVELVEWKVDPVPEEILDDSLYGGVSRRASFQGPFSLVGTAKFRIGFEGFEELVRGAFGTVATTNVNASPLVNDHVIKETPTLRSYQWEVSEGGAATFRYTGVKLSDPELDITAGPNASGMIHIACKVWAKDCVEAPFSTLSVANGATTSGSALVTRPSGSFVSDGVRAGMTIAGTNIPAGATVLSVDTATQITISANATGTGTALALTFTPNFPTPRAILYGHAITAHDGIADTLPTLVNVSACSTTNASTTLTTAGDFTAAGVKAGMLITGTNIPAGTTVVSVGTTTLVMSAAATGTGSSLTMRFDSQGRIRSVNLKFSQPHAEDRDYMGAFNRDEPLRNDYAEPEMTIVEEFVHGRAYAAARAYTVGTPRFVFREVSPITGAFYREFEFRLGNAQLTKLSKPVSGYGIMTQTLTWRGNNASADGSSVVVRIRSQAAALV